MVFVQADDPQLGPRPGGRWLHADVLTDELDEQIMEIHEPHAQYSERTIVTATVGFHGIDIPEDTTARDITRYASGIRDGGEACALFAAHAGYPVGSGAFSIRYHGSYDHITDFMADLSDQTPELSKKVGQSPDSAAFLREVAVDDYEKTLRRTWRILDGREGIHVFSRTFGLPNREDDL